MPARARAHDGRRRDGLAASERLSASVRFRAVTGRPSRQLPRLGCATSRHPSLRRRHSRVPRELQLWSRSLLTWRLVALPQPRRNFFPYDQSFDRHIATSKLLCNPSVETLRNQSPDTSMFAASSARCNIVSRAFRRARGHAISEVGESSHSVFRIIIVPWDTIMIKKRKKLILVLVDPLF
jgi:hypothetical protein